MTSTTASRFSLAIAIGAAIIISCTPQARDNPLDPEGGRYSPLVPGFSSTKMSFVPPANPWDKNIGLHWPTATNITNYRVYLSLTPTRPSTPAFDNVSSTNVNAALLGSGSNHIWVEAVSASPGAASAFIQTNYVVRSGYYIDGTTGQAAAPSIRCINIPVGQTRTVSWAANVSVGAAITGGQSQMKTLDVSGNFEVSFFVTNNISWAAFWTNTVGNVPNFTFFSVSGGAVGVAGTGICSVTIKNLTDTDGFNAIWIDDIIHNGAPANYSQNFSTLTDGQMTGDKEK